jgi:nucleoside-diphosphate-sugar epimerase
VTRVVVVGASGNVGTSVLAALAREPSVDSVLGVSRRRPAGAAVEWAEADVGRDELAPLFRGADAVVHLAWAIQPSHDGEQLRRTNVEGSSRVFRAVAEAGVGSLVYASSVGVYSPGPKTRLVDEDWPREGVRTSFYSRHKAEVERLLDSFEREHPSVRVVRLRPGLIFKREAASGIRRLFAGPLVPTPLLRRRLLVAVPWHPELRVQAVHSLDVGEAYRLALVRDVRGAFNVAAEPVLDGKEVARALGARAVRVPRPLLRGGAWLTWRLHLQPTPPGWVDLGFSVPLLDCTRARRELGWAPAHSSTEALLELLDGLREGAGAETPPLDPDFGGPARAGEVATGVGSRDPASE